MAKSRKPTSGSDLFGSLLRSAVQQLETVREVVVSRTKASRAQFDITLLRRKRRDALAALGEAVVALAKKGKLTEDDFPSLGSGLTAVEALDEKIAREERRARAAAAGMPIARGPEDDEDDMRDDDDIDDEGVVSSASWRKAAAASDKEEYDDDDDVIRDEDDDEVDDDKPKPA